jgi:hypothetical protein
MTPPTVDERGRVTCYYSGWSSWPVTWTTRLTRFKIRAAKPKEGI